MTVDILLVEEHHGDAKLILDAIDGARSDGRIHLVQDGQATLDFLFCRGAYAEQAPNPAPRLVLWSWTCRR
jgi:hypothetical protein